MPAINSYSTRQLRDEEFDEDSDCYFDYCHHAEWAFELGQKLDISEGKELSMKCGSRAEKQASANRYSRGHFQVNIHLRPNRYIVGDLIYDNSENIYIPFKYIDYAPYHRPDLMFYSDEDETTLRVLPLFQWYFLSVIEARDIPGMVEYQTIFKTDDNARRNSFLITRDKFPKIFDAVQTFDISDCVIYSDVATPGRQKTFNGLEKLLNDAANFWDVFDKNNFNPKLKMY